MISLLDQVMNFQLYFGIVWFADSSLYNWLILALKLVQLGILNNGRHQAAYAVARGTSSDALLEGDSSTSASSEAVTAQTVYADRGDVLEYVQRRQVFCAQFLHI